MKRKYCGEDNDREPDNSLLDLHLQSNESSKKLKTMTDATVKNENSLPIHEITEPCDNVIVHQQVTDYNSEIPGPQINDGKIIVLFYQNNVRMEVQNYRRLEFDAVY